MKEQALVAAGANACAEGGDAPLYCVQVAYPLSAGFFDATYYVEKHVPLALRLMREHLGIRPLRVEVLAQASALPGREAPKKSSWWAFVIL